MTFTKSSVTNDSNNNDGNIAPRSPVPQHANDLTIKEIPLSIRTKRLEQLSAVRQFLTNLQDHIILENLGNVEEINTINSNLIKLKRMKAFIDTNKFRVKCEITSCQNTISIYNNLCQTHLNYNLLAGKPILLTIMEIRNLIMRTEFLEEQISSSLSNQITSDDLQRAISETESLYTSV